MPQTILTRLVALNASKEAQDWVTSLPPETTEELAWQACERADWLLWIALRLGVDRALVVLAACACARAALPVWERQCPNDRRPQGAIKASEAWARGEGDIKQLLAAADAAANCAADSDRAYDIAVRIAASVSARAAAYAALTAYAHDSNVTAAAYAALTGADIADAATAADLNANAVYAGDQRTLADLVRKHIPWRLVAARL